MSSWSTLGGLTVICVVGAASCAAGNEESGPGGSGSAGTGGGQAASSSAASATTTSSSTGSTSNASGTGGAGTGGMGSGTGGMGSGTGGMGSGTGGMGSGTGGMGSGTGGMGGAAGSSSSAGGAGGGMVDAGMDGMPPPPTGLVYGHSDTVLYKLNPVTKDVSIVGTFDCITITLPGSGEGMWDIAIDKSGNMVGTSSKLFGGGSLVGIDKATAHCWTIAGGTYPNSLTFVPVGTLDPQKEVLVGYNLAQYVKIDPQTGAQTTIGNLNPNPTGLNWESSGDVVSIIGDKTYLTVKPFGSGSGYTGTDSIVEIDPLTGQATKLIGDTTYPKLWGLGYWGGIAYGFSATGQLCAIDLVSGQGTGIPLMNIPPGLAFWGAGVTTSAPHQ